jgi:hypothetical protein
VLYDDTQRSYLFVTQARGDEEKDGGTPTPPDMLRPKVGLVGAFGHPVRGPAVHARTTPAPTASRSAAFCVHIGDRDARERPTLDQRMQSSVQLDN